MVGVAIRTNSAGAICHRAVLRRSKTKGLSDEIFLDVFVRDRRSFGVDRIYAFLRYVDGSHLMTLRQEYRIG